MRSSEELGVLFVQDPENSAVEKTREEADLLLYPVDFDADSIAYLRHSIPTKLPLYLASGLLLLCCGSDQVEVIRFLNESRLAFAAIVGKKEMLKIYGGHPQLDQMIQRATKYVVQDIDENTIREKIPRLLTQDLSQ